MTESLPPVVQPAPVKDQSGLAIGSLVLGILSLCAWFLPICGGPIATGAVVLGVLGMKSSKRGIAIAGIVLGAIGIVLSLLNAVLGGLIALGGGFDINNIIDQYLP
jgi:hypothetical protein